uniref:Auxin-responsive protein SAUR32 n=1 Tax=Ananas comosus var. bracteatus TaxID=296719 RepID=A0A6V7NSV4_ANACO|nr:unnamed protein product [Ananas comosus var. bracteatus]
MSNIPTPLTLFLLSSLDGGALALPEALGGAGRGRPEAVPPKGWVAIRVLGGEGEEPQRFVVPVAHLNHPLFAGLLREAEEEFGFDQKGAIAIPCPVARFRRVHSLIHRDCAAAANAAATAFLHHHHHHHNFHLSGCFRASSY